AVHRGEEEVAAAVAGEDAAGAVRAVGGRGEAEDEDARRRVAEARDRAAPVLLVGERLAPYTRDLLAPLDQPGAAAAVRVLRGDDLELGHRRPTRWRIAGFPSSSGAGPGSRRSSTTSPASRSQ